VNLKELVRAVSLSSLGIILAILAGEALIRVATSDQKNYVIEMWRYANTLKQKSNDPEIGHEHRPNTAETLQGVEIKINSLGLRGDEIKPDHLVQHRVAVVGDSIALGWGVKTEETLSQQLQAKLSHDYEVINVGVGNMNLSQIIAHFSKINEIVEIDTIVLMVSPRAAEVQRKPSNNFILQHSVLAALISTFSQQLTLGVNNKSDLVNSYKKLWLEGETRENMLNAFNRLSELEAAKKFKVIVLMIPDTNDMQNYSFQFINDTVKSVAENKSWKFFDPLPLLKNKESIHWQVSKNDIHLNSNAFTVIAEELALLVTNVPLDEKNER